jgi:hypothetical protein
MLVGGLVFSLYIWLITGLRIGLGFGFVFGLGTWLTGGMFGLTAVPGDIAKAINPWLVLARDRQAALFLMLGTGLGAGITIGLLSGLLFGLGLADGFWPGLASGFGPGLAGGLAIGLGYGLGGGITVGLTIGLAAAMGKTKWTSYLLTRGWLVLHHQLPWSLMEFLADAHQRGVLRQAGAVYQFRHIELQHRLANRP